MEGIAINYYKRHIGDYAKKAGHLSVLEHGVYTLLLDAYYDRELAPTKAEAIRQARARTPEEMAAVEAVLADFFSLDGDRYTQRRVEQEFVNAEAVAVNNAAKGRLGGRPRKPKGKPEESRVKAGGKPEESRQLSNGKPEESREKAGAKPEESPSKANPLIHQSTNKEQEQERSPSGSRLPAEWEPTPADIAFAEQDAPGVDWRHEAAKFRDYWQSKAGKDARKTNWHQTWRNWLRNSKPARAGPAAGHSKQLSGVAAILGVNPHDLASQFASGSVVQVADRNLPSDFVPAEPRRLPSG